MRLPRLTIAQRLALLSAAVALLMTIAICLLSYFKGRAVLTTHELTDLADETNLRMFEVREEFRYLSREVRETALALPKPPAGRTIEEFSQSPEFDAAFRESIGKMIRSADEHARESPWNWIDSGIGIEAYFLSVRPEGVRRLKAFRRNGDQIQAFDANRERPLAEGALDDLIEQARVAAAKKPGQSRQYLSDLRPLRDTPSRQAVCLGFEAPSAPNASSALFVVAVDFTRILANQSRRSSRHQYFVVNRAGHYVFHPNAARIGTPLGSDRSQNDAPRLNFQKMPWVAGVDPQVASQTTGERLEYGELGDELRFWYSQKSYHSEFPFKEEAKRNDLLRALDALANATPGLRFSRPRAETRDLTLSAPTPEILKEAQRVVTEHEKAAGYTDSSGWDGPIKCETFAAHAVPLNLGQEDSGEPIYLVVAASLEEIGHDITVATRWVGWISLALCIVSAWLALLPAHLMTRPLHRIQRAAQRLAEGDYRADLPVHAPGEIGDLARSFEHMAKQIQQRDQALQDALARMQTVLRTAADGIITFNDRGVIEEWNQAAEQIFGYSAAEIKGQKVNRLMEIPPELSKLDREDSTGETVRSLNRVLNTPSMVRQGRRRDGSTFWMELSFSEVPVGDRRLITGIFRDVTRRVETEERIRQMNELLEARVRLRTAELQDAKGKLEDALQVAHGASRAKDVFVRTVSHELRTPLSAVKGFTELLLNPKATKLRENPVPTLHKIHAASEYLLTLINDLLDVARFTAGEEIHLNVSEFELAPFVAGLLEMTNPLLKKNANRMTTAVDENLGRMRGDETRVRQILLNLLSNACKFTERGEITFRAKRDGDWVEFVVVDTGSGMTAEQMTGLFKPFYRVDNSTTRKAGGTGLGLSITKLLTERMGGTIAVESEPGRGSTFIVRLPIAMAETPATTLRKAPVKPIANGGPPRRPNTVLVIDDDQMSREMVQSFLQRDGIEVLLAASGEEGLRIARDVRPSAITLDVLMPEADGWAVLTALKSDPRTQDIPVIMLTVADDRSRGFTLGASEFVTKPVDWDRLSVVLRQHCDAPGNILIIDDDAMHREHLGQALSIAGWTVREAANGREALNQMEVQAPSVILLDLMMPVMDGFEFLDELRRRPGGRAIPVIVVTARELDASDRRRLNGGVAQILHKGALSREELLARIRDELGNHVPAAVPSAEKTDG